MQQLLSHEEEDDLFKYTSGPKAAEIILVGEAWGNEEAAAQRPFVGSSGKELDRILHDAGLDRSKILCTNLVSARPKGNDFTEYLYPEKEKVNAQHRGIRGRPILLNGLRRLHDLIALVQPKLVVAAGNWPLWALSDHGDITTTKGFRTPKGIVRWRGSQTYTLPINGVSYPLLPIIHPAAILREWGFRQITCHDLRRAAAYTRAGEAGVGSGSKWNAENKTFTLHRPTWEQIRNRLEHWHSRVTDKQGSGDNQLWLSVDLETWRRRYISVIGISDATFSLCIPLFECRGKVVTNYLTPPQECELFERLKTILEHPNVCIIGQNFIYDTEWLYRYYNINAIVAFDTMVAHHLLFPGTPKRLDYLASLYCQHYLYWKDEGQDWDGDIGEEKWRYNCKDTRATFEIAMCLQQVLKQQGMEELYTFQIEQWKLSRQLMLTGTNFNVTLQKGMKLQLLEEANQLGSWLLNAVPEAWQYTSTGKPWYDSPKGTATILYEVLGLQQVLQKKTKKPTTDDAALQELSERPTSQWLRPLLDRLRHLRSLGVFTSNFLDARCSPDGRMRCSFNIAHPETFRWSSNSNGFGEGTNLQNIPGKQAREKTAIVETEEIAVEDGNTDPADPEEDQQAVETDGGAEQEKVESVTG